MFFFPVRKNERERHLLVKYSKRCCCDRRERSFIIENGELVENRNQAKTDEKNGTFVQFTPDTTVFKNYGYRLPYIEQMVWNYCYLNRGLTINLNGQSYRSKDGLKDLLENNIDGLPQYPIIHLEGEDIEATGVHTEAFAASSEQFALVTPEPGFCGWWT